MSLSAILIQVAISLLVVTLYHLWASRKKRPAPAPPLVVAPVATPPKTAPAAKSAPAVEPVRPEILAVIAAAIEVAIGRPYRVVSVHQAAHNPPMSAWALEGRVEQFMSHRVR